MRNHFHLLLYLLLAGAVLAGYAAAPRTTLKSNAQYASASVMGKASNTPSPAASALPTKTQPAATRTPVPTKTAPPTLTVTPTRSPTLLSSPTLPVQAEVKHIWGYGQLLGLSCESRSAADWARHFGVTIHELEFLAKIPRSNNPEAGFVGSPNGVWGNIPPYDYGVHAGPVAVVLRQYGARAVAERNMSFAQLRAEIAADRPVMVWVVGHVEKGKGVPYQVDGKKVTVARYEHTVIVIGYDEKQVKILDGKTVYQRPVDTFIKSWAALENMAIRWDDSGANHTLERLSCKAEYAK